MSPTGPQQDFATQTGGRRYCQLQLLNEMLRIKTSTDLNPTNCYAIIRMPIHTMRIEIRTVRISSRMKCFGRFGKIF